MLDWDAFFTYRLVLLDQFYHQDPGADCYVLHLVPGDRSGAAEESARSQLKILAVDRDRPEVEQFSIGQTCPEFWENMPVITGFCLSDELSQAWQTLPPQYALEQPLSPAEAERFTFVEVDPGAVHHRLYPFAFLVG